MKRRIIAGILAGLAFAAFADAKGDEIAHKYFDLKKAADTSAPGSSMVIIDKSGNKRIRKLDVFYQDKGEGKNAYMVFSAPADVNGTKFLTLGHKGADSDQRLYLPALKKVRKISSDSKDGEFVNSDLWYYDLEERYFEDNAYTFLSENETIADKAFDGMKFWKIEMKPAKSNCPYAKSVAWVNMSDNFIYKLDCYDKKDGSLLKTIVFPKVENIQGVLVPTQSMVTNHKKGSKTLLQLNGVQVNTGIKDEVFSVKQLEQ
jgi:hypothetical protein